MEIKKIGSERIYTDSGLMWRERRVRKKVMKKARELERKGKRIKTKYSRGERYE